MEWTGPLSISNGYNKSTDKEKMKKRYIYLLLFGIPGFLFSTLISLVVLSFATGFLWIFVFGDDPWPSASEPFLAIVFTLVFLTIWLVCLALGFVIGKHLEKDPALNRQHLWISTGITIFAIMIIAFYQFQVGNIGPKMESVRCSDYCGAMGYPASSLPPRESGDEVCSCLDDSGLEVIKIPLESIPTLIQENGLDQ